MSEIVKKFRTKALPSDYATIGYLIITFLFISIFFTKIPGALSFLGARVVFLGIALLIVNFYKSEHNYLFKFIRYFYPLMYMTYLYGETVYIKNVFFDNLDYFFEHIDQVLFGCQPSIEFSKALNQKWFSELMNLGYFSYYFFTFTVSIAIFLINRSHFNKSLFIIASGFFTFYLIYIVIPVAGPQFYFKPPLNQVPDGYIFREGVKFVQWLGEQPTAAFPSSHVGMSMIFLYLSFKYARKVFYIILPLIVLLCFSTVYIKAHYLIDVLVGMIMGFVILFLNLKLHKKLTKKTD